MKAAEAMIAWNPADGDWAQARGDKPRGAVLIGPHPDQTGWSDPYLMTTGACMVGWDKLAPAAVALMVFIEFNTLVVRDGIDPQTAHAAFLAIDEYRERIAPDIPGATGSGWGGIS